MARRIGRLSTTEQAKLEKMYTSGPAAYGSAKNLQETSKMPKAKIDTFLQQKDAHTKYRQIQRKFPRLKVIAYEINEIWSIDVAYVDKLAKYNNGVKYLLVAVDVLSRFLRVVPMRSKSAPDAAKAFEKMIEKVQPQKVWSDKGTEFKGAFKNLCDQRGIATYTTASETVSFCREKHSFTQKYHVQTHGKQMDISLHQQAISICQHNQLTRQSCYKVGPKQSYKEARATFTISSCRAVEQICQKTKV